MKITALVENVSYKPEFDHVHGLSFYIETGSHRLLFDVGPDDTFLKNARRLGVDLAGVDTVVISHGHYDHGGGLRLLLEENDRAKIYISSRAFGDYYARKWIFKKYIGLDQNLPVDIPKDRLVLTGEKFRIDDGLYLVSGVEGKKLFTKSSASLLMKQGDKLVSDTYAHEQSLVITEGERRVLLGGCAHCGIVNILERAQREAGPITHLISGFHLMNPEESEALIRDTAGALAETGVLCYTCHCTGQRAFGIMQEILGERMKYFSAGMQIEI